MADDEKRPASGMRGRATRRGAAAKDDSAADAGGGADDDDESSAAWKVEMESIMAGTHPTLVEALEPHDQKMKALVAQADRIRQLQIININAHFECEKKQAEDESIAHMEFFKSRLIDTIEEKQKKAAPKAGTRGREADTKQQGGGDNKRKREASTSSSLIPTSYTLKPEELKADMEEITTNVDHYSVRSAAAASDELRSTQTADAWFDRSRQLLHCNGQSFDRGSQVLVYLQGQRVDEQWTLTAMNAVEVTLRDVDSTKLKVTLAQLRNGRYAFRPAHGGF